MLFPNVTVCDLWTVKFIIVIVKLSLSLLYLKTIYTIKTIEKQEQGVIKDIIY